MIKHFNGNLLIDADVQVISHQVNCWAIMGNGIAKSIREMYPKVNEEYIEFCLRPEIKNPSDLLGCFNYTMINPERYIVNLFGQNGVSRAFQQTDYVALGNAMRRLKEWMIQEGLTTLGFPYKIGCGLGGGDWDMVSNMIEEIFGESQIECQIWRLQ